MLFVKRWIRHKLWVGPPGPRGSPWTRSWLIAHKDLQLRGEAGQGAGRGPGGPPHNLCRWSVMGKACGIKQKCLCPIVVLLTRRLLENVLQRNLHVAHV